MISAYLKLSGSFIITPFSSWSTRYAPNEHLFCLLITVQLLVSRNATLFGLPVRGESRKVLFCFYFAVIKLTRVAFSQRKHCLFFSKRQNLLDRSRASTCCHVRRLRLADHHVITKSVDSIGQISGRIYNCLKRPSRLQI